MGRRTLLVLLAACGAVLLFVLFRAATWSAGPVEHAPSVVEVERLPLLEPAPPDARGAIEGGRALAPAQDRAVRGFLAADTVAVEARCVDPDGRPLEGVAVRAALGGFSAGDVSGGDGRVRIEHDFTWLDVALTFEAFVRGRSRRHVQLFEERRVQVSLRAAREGWSQAGASVSIPLGQSVDAGDLVLWPAASVEGVVLDADLRPVAGVVVGAVAFAARDTDPEGRLALALRHAHAAPATSDALGRFRIDDAPACTVRVFARDAARIVALEPGRTTSGVDLVLPPERPRGTVSGVVSTATGEPVPRARVEVFAEVFPGGPTCGPALAEREADDAGAFSADVEERGTLRVEARGDDGFGSLGGVRVGATDLVVQLAAPSSIEVELAIGDTASPRFVFVGSYAEQDRARNEGLYAPFFDEWATPPFAQVRREAARDGERLLLAVPPGPFRVRAHGDRLAEFEAGPFLADEVAEPLRIELASPPRATGVVVADGAPVPGALVWLLRPREPGSRFRVDGFSSRFEPTPPARADDRGRFDLSAHGAGPWTLRAEAPGRAPCELGPLAAEELADRTLVLDRGGDIEGEVVVAAGRSPAGIVVGISRGDGFARSQRTDRDGRFRFECVVPGPWFVGEHAVEVDPTGRSHTLERGSRRRPLDDLPETCRVSAGRTTFVRLDLSAPPLALRGKLLVDEASRAGIAVVRRSSASAYSSAWLEDRAVVGPDGRFALRVPGAGEYELTVAADVGGSPAWSVIATVVVAEEGTEWGLDVATGTLSLQREHDDVRMLHHVARAPAGAVLRTRLEPGERAPRVPAGPGAVVVEPHFGEDPALWPVLAEVEVPAGGVARATLR